MRFFAKQNSDGSPEPGDGSEAFAPWRRFLGHVSKEEDRKWRIISLSWAMLLLLGSALALGIMSLRLAPGSFSAEMFRSYFDHPLLVLLNLLPVVWLAVLCWFMSGRVWVSVLITGGVTLVLTLINAVKLTLRNTPFLWEDLALASEAGDMMGKYTIQFTDGEWFALGAWAVLMILCALLTGRKLPGWKSGWKVRGGGALLTALAAVLAWQPVYQSASVYQKTANNDLINIWNDTQVYQSRGFLYPFLYSAKSARDDPPEGYDKKEAAALLDEYRDADIPEEQKVSVLGIMLEAYCDLTEFDQLAFAEPAYEAFHALQAESWSGTLITNIFAGGTIDTERCFVTGYADLGSFRAPTWSYAWYFREQGYATEGGHPGYSWFYNRTNVNENLGFQQYLFTENYYGTMIDPEAAPYHSDGVFLDHLADRLEEQTKDGTPCFSFNVTYQNHGPYDAWTTIWSDYMPEDCAWSEGTRNILNNYLDGVRRTGEHLAELTERLSEMDEPVVLVAFGDHKPWLGDDNSVYREVGIELDLGTETGFYNYYSTPYFIWANPAAKEALDRAFEGEGPTISPCFLMSELFDQCGWEGPAFLQLSREVKAELPVFTSSDRYLTAGVAGDALTEEQRELARKFDWVQYYLRKDYTIG